MLERGIPAGVTSRGEEGQWPSSALPLVSPLPMEGNCFN